MDKPGVLMSSSVLAAGTITSSSSSLKLSGIKYMSKHVVLEDTGVTLTCGCHYYGDGIQ